MGEPRFYVADVIVAHWDPSAFTDDGPVQTTRTMQRATLAHDAKDAVFQIELELRASRMRGGVKTVRAARTGECSPRPCPWCHSHLLDHEGGCGQCKATAVDRARER